MKLRNGFSTETRELFRDCWACWICGMNGVNKGGLELNHTTGRNSDSPLNASLLCKECHSHIGHSAQEEDKLIAKTICYLRDKYKMTKQDEIFLENLGTNRVVHILDLVDKQPREII